jgi:hypothetical protein
MENKSYQTFFSMMNNKNTWKTSKPSRRDKETLQEKNPKACQEYSQLL